MVENLYGPFYLCLEAPCCKATPKLIWFLLFGKLRILDELERMTPQHLFHWKISQGIVTMCTFPRPGDCTEKAW